MVTELEDRRIYKLWIHWEDQVISFQETAGFDAVQFVTHDGMIGFALERCQCGFRVQ